MCLLIRPMPIYRFQCNSPEARMRRMGGSPDERASIRCALFAHCESARVCVQRAARCVSARHVSCTTKIYTRFALTQNESPTRASMSCRLPITPSLHASAPSLAASRLFSWTGGARVRPASCPLVDSLPMSFCLSWWRDVVCAIL